MNIALIAHDAKKELLVQDPDGYLLRFSEDIGSFTT